jgi:hypothetical protein
MALSRVHTTAGAPLTPCPCTRTAKWCSSTKPHRRPSVTRLEQPPPGECPGGRARRRRSVWRNDADTPGREHDAPLAARRRTRLFGKGVDLDEGLGSSVRASISTKGSSSTNPRHSSAHRSSSTRSADHRATAFSLSVALVSRARLDRRPWLFGRCAGVLIGSSAQSNGAVKHRRDDDGKARRRPVLDGGGRQARPGGERPAVRMMSSSAARSGAPGCEAVLISLSALGSSQSVRGSGLGFSIPCRAVRRPESSGSLPRQGGIAARPA